MRKWIIIFLIVQGLFACKSTDSTPYGGIVQKDKDSSEVYFFKVLDEEALKALRENSNYRYHDTYSDSFDIPKECTVCVLECKKENIQEMGKMNNSNVEQICDQNPRVARCTNVGFNETNKLYNRYKSILKSDDVTILNQVDSEEVRKFFEFVVNNVDEFTFHSEPKNVKVCFLEAGDKVVFSNGWKEIEADKIYKWEGSSEYYHATNELRYDNKDEAQKYCNGLKDLGYKWRLISSKEFDEANIDRQIAIFIPSRMHLEPGECFFTSDGKTTLKTFSDDDEAQVEKCRNASQGLALCVSNG